MDRESFIEKLQLLSEEKYRKFQSTLIPTIPLETIIGVKIPILRKLSKEISKEFLSQLPHQYYEENIVHSILLSQNPDFEETLAQIEAFLPYIDNWSVCDTLIPLCFSTHKQELLPYVEKWIASPHVYTCRFGIGVYMRYFLKEDFDAKFLEAVANIQREEYYVNMMIAWYFATALAFQYEAAVPYLEKRQLSRTVHQKTIQKAIESFRVSLPHKQYLKTLRY